MNNEAQKQLASAHYWDSRYAGDAEEYEWLKSFEQLRPFLEKRLPRFSECPRILQLGCGTSTMTADLYSLGYRNQVSVDFSPVAIEVMKSKYQSLDLDWKVMIDKSTLDAMLHGSLWDAEDDVKANAKVYADEVSRVLKPGGRWLCLTYRQPHFLMPLLLRPDKWMIQVETLEAAAGSFEYFGFVMTRNSQ